MNAFSWFGSKAHLVPHLVAEFPALPHSHYVEPFGGCGAVILNKPRHTIEIFNDLDRNIATYFWVLGDPDKSEQLNNRLRETGAVFARDIYCRCHRILEDPGAADAEKAFAFVYTQFCNYAGSCSSGFCMDIKRKPRTAKNLLPWAEQVRWRFQDVTIECRDYRDLLKRVQTMAGPGQLFAYCDPPYHPLTRVVPNVYKHEMGVADHEEMLRFLTKCDFYIMLSGYDHDLYRDYLSGWRLKQFETRCWSSPSKRKTVESVWMNYSTEGELI